MQSNDQLCLEDADYTSTISSSSSPMPPPPPLPDDSHQQLLDALDVASLPRPFRHPNWRPSARRNKNIKQIISEASRKEASVLATQNNSGATTPLVPTTLENGRAVSSPPPLGANSGLPQSAYGLSTIVLERNMQAAAAAMAPGLAGAGPVVTYSNIEAAPSLHPARQKPYCDITGLPASYTDPKTRLRYYNKEVYEVVRTLPQGTAEQYLEARGAHVVLK